MHNFTKLFGIIGMAAVAVVGMAVNYPLDKLLIIEAIIGAAFGVSVRYPTFKS